MPPFHDHVPLETPTYPSDGRLTRSPHNTLASPPSHHPLNPEMEHLSLQRAQQSAAPVYRETDESEMYHANGADGRRYQYSQSGHGHDGYGSSHDHSSATMVGGAPSYPPPPPLSSQHGHGPSSGGLYPGGSVQGHGGGPNPFYAQGEDPSYASGFTHGTAAEPYQALGYEDEAKIPLTEEDKPGYPPRVGQYGWVYASQFVHFLYMLLTLLFLQPS
jgi:hypothetical protein